MADKEYIERGALISILDAKSEMAMGTPKAVFASVSKMVELLPAADVVEVRHGEWDIKSRSWRMIDDYDEEIYVECPFCKRTFYVPYELDDEKALAYARENYPYCHCGAKMDGERKEQA